MRRLEAEAAEHGFPIAPQGGFRTRHYPGKIEQLIAWVSNREQRVARAHDQRRTVVKNRFLMQVVDFRFIPKRTQDQVDFPIAQRTGQFCVTAFVHGYVDAGMVAREHGDCLWQPSCAAERHCPDNNAAPSLTLPGGNLRQPSAQFSHCKTEPSRSPFTTGRQKQAAPAPFQQALPQRNAQISNRPMQ